MLNSNYHIKSIKCEISCLKKQKIKHKGHVTADIHETSKTSLNYNKNKCVIIVNSLHCLMTKHMKTTCHPIITI
ncbi:hypothetical protein Hanom_Chr17g01544201 [Helianthus anomalus]